MVFTCFYALVRGCCWSTLSKMTQTLPGGSPKWGFGRSSTIAILPPPSSQPHELPLYITAMKNPPQKTTKTIQQLQLTHDITHFSHSYRSSPWPGRRKPTKSSTENWRSSGPWRRQNLGPKNGASASRDERRTFDVFFFCQETVGDISP